MLAALCDAVTTVKKSVGKGVVKSAGKMLSLLKQFPEITRERLAEKVGQWGRVVRLCTLFIHFSGVKGFIGRKYIEIMIYL